MLCLGMFNTLFLVLLFDLESDCFYHDSVHVAGDWVFLYSLFYTQIYNFPG